MTAAETAAPVSYDLAGATRAVGVSERTLRDAIATGDLVAHYIGRKPLIRRADLDAWVRALPTERRTA